MLFVVMLDGNVIVDRPMTLEQIKAAFGPINKLEAEGFRVVQVKKPLKGVN